MYNIITNLLDYQRAGLDFQNRDEDKSITETMTGVQRKVVRKVSTSYVLTLQDLSKNDIKEIIDNLDTLQLSNSKVSIPVDLFTGYLGEGVGVAYFNYDLDKIRVKEDEEIFTFALPVTEVTIPDPNKTWILYTGFWDNGGVWLNSGQWNFGT